MQEFLKKQIRWAEYLPQHPDSSLHPFALSEKIINIEKAIGNMR